LDFSDTVDAKVAASKFSDRRLEALDFSDTVDAMVDSSELTVEAEFLGAYEAVEGVASRLAMRLSNC
jgi:hypothetical protein